MLPVTLTAIMRSMRAADISSTREVRPDDAGIVDQRAERSEPVGRLEQRHDIALFADIAFHRDGLAVARLDGGDHLVRGGFIARIADAHPESACRGGDRGGTADAAAAAGDDHNPVRQNSPPTPIQRPSPGGH